MLVVVVDTLANKITMCLIVRDCACKVLHVIHTMGSSQTALLQGVLFSTLLFNSVYNLLTAYPQTAYLVHNLLCVFCLCKNWYQKYFHPIMTILLRLFQIAYRSFLALVKGVEGLGILS